MYIPNFHKLLKSLKVLKNYLKKALIKIIGVQL